MKNNNSSILRESKRIIIGLILSGAIVAILGGYSLTKISQTIERNELASKLVFLLDTARLEELIFTRDRTKESAQKAKDTLCEILSVSQEFHNTNPDNKFNTKNLLKEITTYKEGFDKNVLFYNESIKAKETMVMAARQASLSSEALQNLQEKYVDYDKASVRSYRYEMAAIIENASLSYELVVIAEMIKNYEMSYLLFHNTRDLELAYSELNKMSQIINTLKSRIKNPQSKDILVQISNHHEQYHQVLKKINPQTKPTDEEALEFEHAAIDLRRTALSLQRNEKDILQNIQTSVNDLQELLVKRLELFKEVTLLMKTINNARQSDRDFSLAKTEEGKDIFIQEVLSLLQSAIYSAKKISNILIEDDEKIVFKNVQKDIGIYFNNFKKVVEVFRKSNRVESEMVSAALSSDKILSTIRQERYLEMQDAKDMSYYTSIAGIIILIVIGLLIVLIYKLQSKLVESLEEARDEIKQSYKHTQSSIEYASLIQHALIPETEDIQKYFNNHITIWEPKDLVGGDIYIFEELRNKNECLLMVIDCTGHGVPGAFVTMLVKAIERQVIADILNSNEEVSPAEILKYFNGTMKKLLKQENEDSLSNAGFDGAILYYNRAESYIKFSGAEVPLFLMDGGELKTIKGDRHSIGYKKSDAEYTFTEHKIEVKKGMRFYLTTDGYLDQNGGDKGFPFGKKRFQNIITQFHNKTLNEQKNILIDTLHEYQQGTERNDDITLVGFEIEAIESFQTILDYEGILTQNIISHNIEIINYKITNMNLLNQISTTVIELTQNMMSYSKSQDLECREILPEGFIEVTKDESNTYYIKSKNIISIEDKEKLEPKLNEIQTLSNDEIKKKYRELRRSGKDSHEGGAGIGFYEIAKRSDNIEFGFKQINEDKYYFNFSSIIYSKEKNNTV